jgi:hypothetical protein
MPQVERTREIKRRRQRRDKVHDLRARLATEKDAKVRARLLAKLKKTSPNAPAPEK